MKLDEDKLSTAIKSREISRVNYLYGEERFLVKTYTDRLLDATVGKDRNDINLIKLAGTFPAHGQYRQYAPLCRQQGCSDKRPRP